MFCSGMNWATMNEVSMVVSTKIDLGDAFQL